jgi:hypothetical protein
MENPGLKKYFKILGQDFIKILGQDFVADRFQCGLYYLRGSNPPGCQGWHLASLRHVKNAPLNKPYFANAWRA